MKDKKGQALVEFVIILPIFIFMLLAIIDVGKIIYYKNELESEMASVVELYKNQNSYQSILDNLHINDDEINLEIKNQDNELVTFKLEKEVAIVTPGLNFIFDNPYQVEVTRVMSYE